MKEYKEINGTIPAMQYWKKEVYIFRLRINNKKKYQKSVSEVLDFSHWETDIHTVYDDINQTIDYLVNGDKRKRPTNQLIHELFMHEVRLDYFSSLEDRNEREIISTYYVDDEIENSSIGYDSPYNWIRLPFGRKLIE